MSNTNKNFNGTIDQLLKHCAQIDLTSLDQQIAKQNKAESIAYIQQQLHCTKTHAAQVYKEIYMLQIQDAIDELIKKGKVSIVGYNKNGEAMYKTNE